MPLLTNSLLEWTEPDGKHRVERVVHADPARDEAQVIRIDQAQALPQPRRLTEIAAALSSSAAKILKVDPFGYLQKPESSISAKHRRRRDRAWALIEPIVTAPNHDAFNPEARGRLVRAAIEKGGSTKKHVYRYLRRYWQCGMTPNTLLPNFSLCGAPGKERNAGPKKRGRPRLLTRLKGAPPGINIRSEEAEKIRKGYRQFFEKMPEDGGRTLRRAYEETLRKFFRVGFEFKGSAMLDVLPSADQLPTFDQFRYWGRKGIDVKDSLIRRGGERAFNLRSRAVLGDATAMAIGPGGLAQIDSTVGDIWVVSALNRSRRIGRPVAYFVVDTFSHLIMGFHVGLENPSFFAAGLALENATLDKVAYAAQFGIHISPEEWPSCGIPEAILADRGELEGHSASNLVQSLGIRIANTSAYRPDLKPIVERTFRSINDLLLHGLPGSVRKPKERGERDPRLDAVLTLQEVRVLIIHAIVQHNSRRIEGYRLQSDMIADGIEPRPTALWEWGITARSGHLRMADAAVVRANLFPGGSATVTFRGIRFQGLHYSCDRAIQEGWYEKARSTRSWQVNVAYDPRLVDTIILRLGDSRSIEYCQLLEADKRFQGMSWSEINDFFLSQKETKEESKTRDLQARATLQSQVEAIVNKATDQAALANQGLPKSARLRGVRENRRVELGEESAMAAATEPSSTADSGESLDALAASTAVDRSSREYVPPPSPLEMLRRQRETKWANHDQH